MANEKHYVKNDEFLAALIDYKTKCDLAEKEGKTEPPIPNYIGECFLKIAEHLSRKPNFISYSFRDEMIADGIENCLMYFRNFDPANIDAISNTRTFLFLSDWGTSPTMIL